jgi:hypothetical protein
MKAEQTPHQSTIRPARLRRCDDTTKLSKTLKISVHWGEKGLGVLIRVSFPLKFEELSYCTP